MSEPNYEKIYVSNAKTNSALVSIIMGSTSDWDQMKKACEICAKLEIPWETIVISAHRTPERLRYYAQAAESRGIQVIIAGAGGAAHLPGTIAAISDLPVHGVPIQTSALSGIDSLYSIIQMPTGIPTATFAIGKAGAPNAALQAARILALSDSGIKKRLKAYIKNQTDSVPLNPRG